MPLHSDRLLLIFTVRDNRSSFSTLESLSSSDLKDTWACIDNPGHISLTNSCKSLEVSSEYFLA